MKRKICIVTTSRSDYGLLYWLLSSIKDDVALELQLIVSGMHLCPEFGATYKIIEEDGFVIDQKIEMLLSADTETGAIKSLGVGLLGFSDALRKLSPDILVLLGDRFELLAPAISALMQKIPIAHIHGGEASEGVVDESVRHAITKIASLHFPATEVYRQRIIQMGEYPGRVFNYGAPGLDNIYKLPLMSKHALEEQLHINLSSSTAIVTYHPVTLENYPVTRQIDHLLHVIAQTDLQVIFTQANADAAGRLINHTIEEFCRSNPVRYKFIPNLGQVVYLSCLRHVTVMIGNSSSGLIEAPSFKLPVVNIGDRQRGRIKAANVLDTGYDINSIQTGIERALSQEFREQLQDVINPYQTGEDGTTSLRIKDTLKNTELSEALIKKTFFDIRYSLC